MTKMLEASDWKGFAARKRESKKRGKLRGIGISNYVETPVGIPHERVEVTVLGSGSVELAVGTQSTGQGHETTFAQVMADLLGVRPEDIKFIGGDTQAGGLRQRHALRPLDAARRHADGAGLERGRGRRPRPPPQRCSTWRRPRSNSPTACSSRRTATGG